jgi:hypothetical protein
MIEGMRFYVNGLITVSESLMGHGVLHLWMLKDELMNMSIRLVNLLSIYTEFLIMLLIYCSLNASHVMCHVSTLHQSNSTPVSMHCFHHTT